MSLLAAASSQAAPFRLRLDDVTAAKVAQVLGRDVMRRPYVVTPELSKDTRRMSIWLEGDTSRGVARLNQALVPAGLVAYDRRGLIVFDLVDLEPPGAAAPQKVEKPLTWVSYVPSNRRATELAASIEGLFDQVKVKGDDGAGASGLVRLSGPDADVHRAAIALEQGDKKEAQIRVSAAVYEVATGRARGTALRLAASALGLGAETPDQAASPGDNVFRLETGGLSAAIDVLSRDNRFQVITAPSLMTRPGVEAVFTSGSQVPVLGAVTAPQLGAAVQTIEYRDSGVILKVTAHNAGGLIRLEILQEISNFVRTETGVQGSPTLQRRAITNSVTVRPGEVIALAGLVQERDETSKSGLFGGWLGSRRKETQKGEIVVFLQASPIDDQ